jgi:hypothetical protein
VGFGFALAGRPDCQAKAIVLTISPDCGVIYSPSYLIAWESYRTAFEGVNLAGFKSALRIVPVRPGGKRENVMLITRIKLMGAGKTGVNPPGRVHPRPTRITDAKTGWPPYI